MELNELHRGIEAILFAAGEPVELARLAMALEADPKDVAAAAEELANEWAFQRRGIRMIRLDNALENLPAHLAKLETNLLELQQRQIALQAELQKQEDHAERIAECREKLKMLDKKLGVVKE